MKNYKEGYTKKEIEPWMIGIMPERVITTNETGRSITTIYFSKQVIRKHTIEKLINKSNDIEK